MKLTEFGLLTDENVNPHAVAFLRSVGFDVIDVCESGWQGQSDRVLLATAAEDQRIVVTHDADFGRLAIIEAAPLTGIIFLRPGHLEPQFTIDTIKAILATGVDFFPPSVLVAKRRKDRVTVRLRSLSDAGGHR